MNTPNHAGNHRKIRKNFTELDQKITPSGGVFACGKRKIYYNNQIISRYDSRRKKNRK